MDYNITQEDYTVPTLKGYKVEHRDHNGYTWFAKGKPKDDCLAPKFWSFFSYEARLYKEHEAAEIVDCQQWCRMLPEYTASRKKKGR